MKARVIKATGERGKDVTLATFHAFCESLLADVAPDRLMLDTVDHWILLRRIWPAFSSINIAASPSPANF